MEDGREALERLSDLTIAPNDVRFEIDAVHTGGSEAAVVASVTLRLATGATADYDGVFLYRIDGDGRIVSMRSFFDLARLLAAFGG